MKKTLSLAKQRYYQALIDCISQLKSINETLLKGINGKKNTRKDLNSIVMAVTRNNQIINYLEKELE